MKKLLRISDLRKSSIVLFNKVILSVMLLLVIGLIRLQAQTVTDIDGNLYNTVTIGTQVWMKENLKTTKYNDGTTIPNITDNTVWAALITGAYSDYNNTPTNSTTYGRLYNWYAADNNSATKVASNGGKNVCPTAWHMPSDAEWTTLTTFLGGESVAGGKLKETGTTHWTTPNTGATDETGFTALPGGYRYANGTFNSMGSYGYWMSSTEYSSTSIYNRFIFNNSILVYRTDFDKRFGFSVRCLRDQLATDITNPSTLIIEIYPNPVSGILTIDYQNENIESLNILNSQGVLLTKERALTPGQQLDFSKYVSGLYFLEFVNTSGEIRRVKVIKR